MTAPLTPAQLDELERLHREAASGEWRFYLADARNCFGDIHFGHGGYACHVERRDATLIVAMRNALPALLEAAREADRLRALLDKATVFQDGDASAIRTTDGMWLVFVEDHSTQLVGEHATAAEALAALERWRGEQGKGK